MSRHTSVVVFDVNETLSDMAPMAERFADVGAPPHLAKLWFASLLRDGFARTAAGSSEQFKALAEGALATVLAGVELQRSTDDATAHVMSGFAALEVHRDVPDGVRALAGSGLRLVTLTNGSTEVADRLLTGAGLREHLEQLLSVEQAGVWKPAAGAYAYAAQACSVPLEQMLLVAVHPWDIDGADRAGMRTAWLNRGAVPYPGYFRQPDITARTLLEVAEQLDD